MVYLGISVRDCSQQIAGRNGWTNCLLQGTQHTPKVKFSLSEPNPQILLQANQWPCPAPSRARRKARCELGNQFLLSLFLPASLLPRARASRIKVVPSWVTPTNSMCMYCIFHLDGESFPEQGWTLHKMQSCYEITFCSFSGNTDISSLAEIKITFWSWTDK